jgi:hypothetical protein
MASLPPAADDTRTTTTTGAPGRPGMPRRAGRGRVRAGGVCPAGLALLLAAVAILPAGAAEPTGYRRLAPGVLTVIPADRSGDDALLRADILEITAGLGDLAWEPKQSPVGATLVEQGRNRDFPRDIWALEFAFKPPRQIDIDVPARDFRMQRKRVWYLVYRVKNTGARRIVMADGDATRPRSETVQQPVRFLPHFVLESVEGLSKQEGALAFRAYLDRVVPGAVAAIREREDTRLDLHDSARMSERDLTPGEERWGVAVWEDVDPRIDFFSVYVRGLTNAIRWRPRADATFAADSVPVAGEEHVLESLRLDFWRPGDDATSLDDEMSVGHAGMYERRTIGSRVLEALGRGRQTASAPREGLEQLGLTWEEILDPPAAVKAAASFDRETPPSLVPLTKVVNALARLQPPAARPAAIRTLFGGVGEEWFEELVRGLSAPLDEERGALRRGMLDRCGVSEEDVANRPLESVVKVLAALDATTPAATRRSATVALFGAAAPRLDSLVHELDLARARAVLDDMDFDRRPVLAGGALTAYDTMLTVFGAETDAAKRARMVTGLLGAEGPALLAAATAVREGVDHAWVFRYER